MMTHQRIHGLLALLPMLLCTSAQAGPAMFQASFIMRAFGNTTTTGSVLPFNTYGFLAMPFGHNCRSQSPYTPTSSLPAPYYCTESVLRLGSPATGSGTLVFGGATVGGPIGLPANAFGHGDWLGGHYTWTTSTTPSGLQIVNVGTGTSITPSTHMYGGFMTRIDARNGITGFMPV